MNHLGVEALTKALTNLLVSQIEVAIPAMQKEITNQLSGVERSLKKIRKAGPETVRGCKEALSSIVTNWPSTMKKVSEDGDYSELPDCEEDFFLLWFERKKRTEFAESVRKTKPSFDEVTVSATAEISEIPSGTERRSYHKEVGDAIENLKWGPDIEVEVPRVMPSGPRRFDLASSKSASVGDTVLAKYTDHGFAEARITKVHNFRADLLFQIDIFRGRELPGFWNFGVFR